jgi:hypothetical protein
MLLSGEDHLHLRLSTYRPFTALSSAADSPRARSMAARMLACSALPVRQASLQRTQERLQTDHRPAPVGPRREALISHRKRQVEQKTSLGLV